MPDLAHEPDDGPRNRRPANPRPAADPAAVDRKRREQIQDRPDEDLEFARSGGDIAGKPAEPVALPYAARQWYATRQDYNVPVTPSATS